MSGIQGIHHAQHHLQAQGGAAAGRIDPRLAGVVRQAVPATPRLATDLSQAAQFPDKPLAARQASVVAQNVAQKGQTDHAIQ